MPASRNYSSTAGLMRLVGGITGGSASLVVDVTTGLPTVPFTLLLDPSLGVEEVVEVTAVGGTTLTVTRGVDGTSAQAHTNGAEVRHAYSARDFQDSRNHEANTTTAHGVTGAAVGTTNTQALTNKTVDGSLNTFTNVPKVALPADVTYNDTAQTLTNKTLDGASNTFTNVPVASVVGLVDNEAATADHAAATAAHGATGAVVGTTNTQTLIGKTMSGASNTFSNIPYNALVNIADGVATVTTDASGYATVTHGLAFTPNRVFLQGNQPSVANNILGVDTLTATTFRVRVVTGTGAAATGTFTFFWDARGLPLGLG